ncbi:MAG: hypothetical protein LQ343_000763 [Gyalolechia ehrenbergii]|nr:MAG: hypothetical protein LQ343_000763 [Gyalolechia ehrenbergii]
MCCRTTSTDTCRDDGLCDSSWDGNVWRDFCTDPTWQAPNCVKLCLDSQGTDGDGKVSKANIFIQEYHLLTLFPYLGNTGGSVRVTQCPNGSYCCGVGSTANTCCSNGVGVWVAKNGQTTNVNPTATASRSSTAAASSSTISKGKGAGASTTTTGASVTPTTVPAGDPASQTASAPSAAVTTTVTTKSTNNTGAIAGGVVAGILAAAIIIGAAIWILRRRRNRQMDEKRMWAPSAMQKPPPLYGEMDGSSKRHELPAPVGHEMATGAPIPKRHGAAELP